MNFNKSSDTKFYDLLGISKTASEDEIKRAYKKCALKYHPDRNRDNKEEAEKKFKEIGKAYEILSDPQKKDLYDKYGEEAVNNSGGPGGASAFDIFEQMFGGAGGPFGGMGGPFGGMGGMFGERASGPKVEHKKIQIKLTFEEMMNGGTRKIKHKRRVIKDRSKVRECVKCNGTGTINRIVQLGPGMISQSSQPCGYCRGTGKIVEYSNIEEEIEINIKPGTKKGDHIRIECKGDEVAGCDELGDLIVIFDEEMFDYMQRQGNDLVYLKKILLSESLCGLEFKFKHPSGKNIIVNYNNIIKPNDVKVINGLGFPINTYRNGNFIIKFDVIFPDNIDNQKKELIHKLLPKRNKLKSSEIEGCDKFQLEEFNGRRSAIDSDDEETGSGGVQCAQQ